MPWFKVDDKLHSHRKAVRAGDAMALWVVAGSWCADQLTDGFVPDYVAERLMPDAQRMAETLVEVGMWDRCTQSGDDGWRFSGWDEYQPIRADVEAKRERARDKKRQQRRTPTGQYEVSPGESPRDTTRSPQGSPAVPTRPDPTPKTESSRTRSDRATRLPDGWTPQPEPDLIAAAGGQATADSQLDRFRDYWAAQPGAKGRKVDWQATWRNWLRRHADERQPQSRDGPAPRRQVLVGSPEWDRQRAEQEALGRRLLGDTA